FGIEKLEPVVRIGNAPLDLFAAELTREYRVQSLDPLRRIAIGNCLYFERMQIAEVGDLIERQGGVFKQPHGGRFRHQRNCNHWLNLLSCFASSHSRGSMSSPMTELAGTKGLTHRYSSAGPITDC